MAAVLTGTPTAIVWAAGANPAGQSITIPTDCTAVYFFWTFYNSAAGNGLTSVTLNGASPNQSYEIPTATGDQVATGVSVWYNPPTGSQTLDPAWDAAPAEGPTTIVAYVKDGNTTSWTAAIAANETGTTAVSASLTTVSGDLVLVYDQKYNATPSAQGGSYTSQQTTLNASEGARLSSISASGSSLTINSVGPDYSSILGVSIPAGGGGGGISAALTGVSATGSRGTLAPQTSKALTGQSNTSSVGTLTPSLSKALSGNSAAGSVGTLAPSISLTLSGNAATGAVGTISAGSAVVAALTGVQAQTALGLLAPSLSAAITGLLATGQINSVTVSRSVDLSGLSASGSTGTLSPALVVSVTGVTGTAGIGTITAYFPPDPVEVDFVAQIGLGLSLMRLGGIR